ncbi:MAG: hypothetical protein B1H04_02245 [Planctomycetales bacterium 4484_123]|nr:MAG: hypothetical protein B1H04_02245 [Planctomycetales bacterium 4484_123]
MDQRPNSVLFFPDQWRGDCLGSLGHPVVETPFLDELASEGVTFTAAYSACPYLNGSRVPAWARSCRAGRSTGGNSSTANTAGQTEAGSSSPTARRSSSGTRPAVRSGSSTCARTPRRRPTASTTRPTPNGCRCGGAG